MTCLNDFATTYMCQSLPFGGVKHSGFDRFAGIEGLRGMCIPKVRRVAVPLHALFACGTLLQGKAGGRGAARLQTAMPPFQHQHPSSLLSAVSHRPEGARLATLLAPPLLW